MLGIEDLIFVFHAEVLPVAHIPSFLQLNTQGNCILCAGKNGIRMVVSAADGTLT